MGNANWVCFDCRGAVRRPTHHPDAVPCPQCGCACRCLGTQVRIPAKNDEPAWRALRDEMREREIADQERAGRIRVRRRHRLERRITDLEACPATEAGSRSLQLLRARLESL